MQQRLVSPPGVTAAALPSAESRMPEREENLTTEGFEVEKMDERYNFSRSIFKVGSL